MRGNTIRFIHTVGSQDSITFENSLRNFGTLSEGRRLRPSVKTSAYSEIPNAPYLYISLLSTKDIFSSLFLKQKRIILVLDVNNLTLLLFIIVMKDYGTRILEESSTINVLSYALI